MGAEGLAGTELSLSEDARVEAVGIALSVVAGVDPLGTPVAVGKE